MAFARVHKREHAAAVACHIPLNGGMRVGASHTTVKQRQRGSNAPR